MTELKNNMDANNNQETNTNNTNKEEGKMTMNNSNGNGATVIFTPKQIADLLSVKVSFVNRELREGNLRGFKIGKKSWRVSQDDFNDYCNNRINSTDGKRSVSESTKALIRFHTTVRCMEKQLPKVEENLNTKIDKIKGELPGKSEYEKLAAFMKMKTLVHAKAKMQERLENKDEYLGALAKKVVEPGMMDLLHMDPDEAEEYFLRYEKEQARKKAAPVALAVVNNA